MAYSCCQAIVDREAALRQLTWALHLILVSETASANSRRDQVISFCKDERLASLGACPTEDVHTAFFTYTNTHIYNESNA